MSTVLQKLKKKTVGKKNSFTSNHGINSMCRQHIFILCPFMCILYLQYIEFPFTYPTYYRDQVKLPNMFHYFLVFCLFVCLLYIYLKVTHLVLFIQERINDVSQTGGLSITQLSKHRSTQKIVKVCLKSSRTDLAVISSSSGYSPGPPCFILCGSQFLQTHWGVMYIDRNIFLELPGICIIFIVDMRILL